jgi:hypothetical protein
MDILRVAGLPATGFAKAPGVSRPDAAGETDTLFGRTSAFRIRLQVDHDLKKVARKAEAMRLVTWICRSHVPAISVCPSIREKRSSDSGMYRHAWR